MPYIEADNIILQHAVDVFNNPIQFSNNERTRAYRTLYHDSVKDPQHCPSDQDVIAQMVEMFETCIQVPHETGTVHELVDILLDLHRPTGQRLLDVLRKRNIERDHIRIHQNRNIAIGYQAGGNMHGVDNIFIGHQAGDAGIMRGYTHPIPGQNRDLVNFIMNSQNVHDGTTNNNVKRVAMNLVNMYRCTDSLFHSTYINLGLSEISHDLIKSFPLRSIQILAVISRIKTDNSTFNMGITLEEVIKSLWLLMKYRTGQEPKIEYIVEQESIGMRMRNIFRKLGGKEPIPLGVQRKIIFEENPKEWQMNFKTRLVEEMVEMQGFCATGHIARLINVMQGFVTDNNLQVIIDKKDHCNNLVRAFLTETLKNCEDEEVIDGMTEQSEAYAKFIKKAIHEKRKEWLKEHGKEFDQHINEVTNTFAGMVVF